MHSINVIQQVLHQVHLSANLSKALCLQGKIKWHSSGLSATIECLICKVGGPGTQRRCGFDGSLRGYPPPPSGQQSLTGGGGGCRNRDC